MKKKYLKTEWDFKEVNNFLKFGVPIIYLWISILNLTSKLDEGTLMLSNISILVAYLLILWSNKRYYVE